MTLSHCAARFSGSVNSDSVMNLSEMAAHLGRSAPIMVDHVHLPGAEVSVILYLISRYMRPEGPWQQLRRCRSNGDGCFIYHFPGARPAWPVIVGAPPSAEVDVAFLVRPL